MELNEAIYVMLLNNELRRGTGNPFTDLYKKEENIMKFSRSDLADIANDLAAYLYKDSENVIVD